MLYITPISALKDNYIWLLHHAKHLSAIIVDPGLAGPVLETLKKKNLVLKAILVTHHHWDHTSGIADLLKHFNVPVFGPENENIAHVSEALVPEECIHFAEFKLRFKILAVPGHTMDHIAYYDGKNLFCGDTLFTGGCGRLFEGSAAQLHHSLNQLAALPDETRIYCGHEYTAANLDFALQIEPHNPVLLQRVQTVRALRATNDPTVPSTIAEEKATNPFLRCHLPSVITAVENKVGFKLGSSEEVFAHLRAWKDTTKISDSAR